MQIVPPLELGAQQPSERYQRQTDQWSKRHLGVNSLLADSGPPTYVTARGYRTRPRVASTPRGHVVCSCTRRAREGRGVKPHLVPPGNSQRVPDLAAPFYGHTSRLGLSLYANVPGFETLDTNSPLEVFFWPERVRERDRDRDRDRETERDRDRDRQTDRQTEPQRERDRDRERQKERDRGTESLRENE